YARRNYQSGRLVDVVYVRRHQPKRASGPAPKKTSTYKRPLPAAPSAKASRLSLGRLLPAAAAGLVLLAGSTVLIMTIATNKRVVEQVAAESQLSSSYDGQADEGSPPGEE